MKKIILAVLVTLSAAWLTAQNSINSCPEQLKDYDGNTYNVVRIGNLCWMKENLRTTCYADGEKVDFERTGSIVTGYLYTWNVAKGYERGKQGICPDGWYLPSDWEWQQMEIAAYAVDRPSADKMGGRGDGAYKLCSNENDAWTEGYTSNYYSSSPYYPVGKCNSTGFSALPTEEVFFLGVSVGKGANFWTATEFDKNYALIRHLENDSKSIFRRKEKKLNTYSVRCVHQPENINAHANSIKEEKTDSKIAAKRGNAEKKSPQKANTSDTLAKFANGYVLHKLWTSTINKNIVSAVISQPEGVYRGLLYIRNITKASDIINQNTLDCQHLAGAFEVNGEITDKVLFATEKEWSSIAKTWDDGKLHKVHDEEMYDSRFHFIRQYLPYYRTTFTFSENGNGFQTVSGKSTVYATLINTSYSNGLSGIDRRSGSSVRGGYSYTTEGTAKNNFTWEIRDGHLFLKFGHSPTANVTVTMTDKFENVHQSNRQQMIAQAKRDIASNPEVAEQKKNVTNALKILSGSDVRIYRIMVVSQHTLRLIPAYLDNRNNLHYTEEWIDLYSNDAENMFLPTVEQLVALADTNSLTPYESDYQRDIRPLKENKVEEEKRMAEEKRQEEIKRLQELLSATTSTCTSVFAKLQNCISEKTGYYDVTKMDNDFFNYFDFSSLLSKEEATPTNKATVLQYKLYPWLPLSNYKLDTVEVNPTGNVYALNTLNRKNSPKNVFDTYLTLRLLFTNNSTILIDSITYEAQLWQDNSEKKYDMREQMMEKDKLLLGKYKKSAPFVVKAYLNYQKKNQISVKKHYQKSDPDIQLFTVYQDLYLSIADLRERSIERQQFIGSYAGKAHVDVVKVLETFIRQKERELLPEKEIQEMIETIGVISNVEEECLNFLMNRRIVEENHQQISLKKKTCKYIVDAYEKHFKSLDKSWSLSEKNDKLAGERELQCKVLSLINSTNASELNAKAKQMKKESIEVMIERLK